MTTQEVKRKLTAILIADVKGYSRQERLVNLYKGGGNNEYQIKCR